MKRINMKKVMTVLAVILLIISISTVVFGDSALDPKRINPIDNPGVDRVRIFAGNILAVAQAIGISVAVIMLVVLAIKYFLSSAQDKAEIKKSATAYVLGAVLLFGGVAILNIIQQFATKA